MQRGTCGHTRGVLEGSRSQVPWGKTKHTTWEGKVSGLHDNLHDDFVRNVDIDVTRIELKINKHVRFSDCIYIKIIDDPLTKIKTAVIDRAVFSIDITNDSDVFDDNQLLLDT